MNNSNMYYGYPNFYPLPSQVSDATHNVDNAFNMNYFDDFKNRIERLERQVKRLDQRLVRIETPYANANNQNVDNDDTMYMM